MKPGPPHQSEQDTGWDDNDPVWRLLAQAPRPEPDAWFAARTMARCRNENRGGEWLPRLIGMWRWALGGGLALSMAVALVVTTQVQTEQADNQKNVQDAFEIMASLDTSTDSDTSSSSSSSWQDSSL
jgi:hypothetical protein